MDFRIDRSEGLARVALNGNLTFAENAAFRRILAELDGAGSVVLDLGGMDHIDSAGLGMLMVARETVAEGGGSVRLANASGEVGRMLDLARFQDFFELV